MSLGTRISAGSLLHRVQHGLSNPPVELIYTPHEHWPIPHSRFAPLVHRPLRVLVLDSSYNPPTFAHLALANSKPPPHHQYNDTHNPTAEDAFDYDAKLLLLSVRNADKTMKAGDASYLQRLEMMVLLAEHVVRNGYSTSNIDEGTVTSKEAANVAVGIIDEPTFVGKSKSLLAFLKNRFASFKSTTPPFLVNDTQLTFVVGSDTLERLILPRYYPSESQMLSLLRTFLSPAPEGDDSRIICARRGSSMEDPEIGSDGAKFAIVQEFISSEHIIFIDIGEDVRTYSSTAVRNAISWPNMEAEDWRKNVTSEIADYIVREKLYTGSR